MKRRGPLAVSFLYISLLSGLVLADAGDRKLRFGITWAEPTNDIALASDESFWVLLPPDELVQVDLRAVNSASPEGGPGLSVGFELLVTSYLGVDVNLGYSRIQFDPVASGTLTVTPLVGDPPQLDPDNAETAVLSGGSTGELDMVPLTIGFNFYVLRTRVVLDAAPR